MTMARRMPPVPGGPAVVTGLLEGVGEAELAGVEDAVWIERGFERDEHVEARAERVGEEARPVQADAVVMAQRGAVRERGAHPDVVHRVVVTLALVRRRLT